MGRRAALPPRTGSPKKHLRNFRLGKAPLHPNALGTFNNDPSVKGRLEAFDDSIGRLLWPERRAVPSKQHYWDGLNAVQKELDDMAQARPAGAQTEPSTQVGMA